MMISIIAPPEDAPQIAAANAAALPSPATDDLDREILGIIRDSGRYGLPTCCLLNLVTQAQNPASRAEARVIWLANWRRLRRLLRLGLAFRFCRAAVTATKLPSVRRRRRPRARSTATGPIRSDSGHSSNCLNTNQITQSCQVLAPAPALPQTESAAAPEQASEAARLLAGLRTNAGRPWTGWVGNVRGYHDMVLKLPQGDIAYVWKAARQIVVFTREPGGVLQDGMDGARGNRVWGAIHANEVTVVGSEAGRVLGRLKRGRKERPSELKRLTARLNAVKPPRPGKRARGRPRQVRL